MYTIYMIFAIVLIASFLTGSIVLIWEHKLKDKSKLVLEKGTIIDGEIL